MPDPNQSLTLLELLSIANKAYPDEYLSNYYNPDTGAKVKGSGDGLAEFIVIELIETFEMRAPREEQKDTAIRVMHSAVRQLKSVVAALEDA